MKIEKIFLVPHFHFDFEWWKEEPYHEQDTLVILDEAIKMLDTFPEFTYVIDTILPLKMYIEKRESGFEKLKKFIDQGRIEIVGGDIVAPDEVLPIGEALIRQFEEGQAWLNEVFDIQTQVAWEIDEFAHPARMPQILNPLGFKYFVFARGVKPFDSMHPTLFNWHDPAKKSKLTSYWWAANYEGSLLKTTKNKNTKKRQIRRFFKEMESRIEFEGARSPVPYLMVPLGGDFVIPNELWMDFVKLWNEKKEVKLEFSLPSRYFKMVEQFDIPDYTGLFPHVFDGYFTSREKEKQAARKHANELVELEKLNALSAIYGYKGSDEKLKEAWWEVLKGDFHDTIAGTGTDRVYRKTMARYKHADKLQQEAREHTLGFLKGLVQGNGNFVFNSLNWEREALILSNGKDQLVQAKALSLQPLDVQDYSDDIIFVTGSGIENKHLKIEVSENDGNISVFDKEHSFYPIKDGCNKTNIIDDVGNLWVTRSSNKKYPVRFKGFTIRRENALIANIILQEENSFLSIQKTISLQVKSKQINFKTEIEFRGKDKRIEMEFPFSFEGEWHTENIFHTEKVKDGIYPVQNFSMYEGKEYNTAILNKGIPGYLLNKNTGKLMLMRSVSMISWLLIKWTLKNLGLAFRSIKQAIVYLIKKMNIAEFPVYPVHNLFLRTFASEGDLHGHGAMNKRSHRKAILNFNKESMAWERGKHSFEYAVLLDVQDIGEAVKKAIEFNNPLLHIKMEGKGAMENISLLSREAKDIVISLVRKNKTGIYLRAYEPMGKTIQTELAFAFPATKVFRLKGNTGKTEELKLEKNSIHDVFEPYEIKLYHIEYEKTGHTDHPSKI